MIRFELGNPEIIEDISGKTYDYGQFVFRKDGDLFRLYLGNSQSHSRLVRELGVLADGALPVSIWGGGHFDREENELRFVSSSGSYGNFPNSAIIACCRETRLPSRISGVEKVVVELAPYDPRDPQLEERRQTWRELGSFELDTEKTTYVFDAEMNQKSVEVDPTYWESF